MWTAIVCAILGSQTVTLLVQWLLGKLDKRDNPIRNGVKELLYCKLVHYDDLLQSRGYTPLEDKETVERVYMAYHALGGNGVGTEIRNKVLASPSKEEDK